MKPIIGISSNIKENYLSVPLENIHAVTKFGGVPLILPNVEEDAASTMAELLDGLLLTGGGDIDPTLFGEEPHPKLGNIIPERDVFELALIQKMLEINKPILGICRGAQIVNIAVGGDMYQDIYAQINHELLQHVQKAQRSHLSHFVQVKKGSLLEKIAQTDKFKVNSFHHQANRNVPKGFSISATASDGIIEAFESNTHKFVLCLQWHPESLIAKNDRVSENIFKAFIGATKK